MAIKGSFFNLPAATLATFLTNYTDCLNAIATTGQSYNMYGRQFTRADLGKVQEIIAEIKAAQRKADGTRVTSVYPDFRR